MAYDREMNKHLSFILGSEIRYCALLIGCIQMAWAFLGVTDAHEVSLFARTLRDSGLGYSWFSVMFVGGLFLSLGALLPMRHFRHISLYLSSLIWMATFFVFLGSAPITPVVISMPLFSIFSVLLIYSDAKRKTRGDYER